MKTPIQKSNSSKLYYNKWPYKIECYLKGASLVTRLGVELAKAWCQGTYTMRFYQYNETNKVTILKFITAIEPFLNNKNLQIRTENSHFNIFCKDITLLEELDDKLHEWIKRIHGPTTIEEYNFLIENGHKIILRDSLPKNKYQYKLYFKSNFPIEKRTEFYLWSNKYADQLSIDNISKYWLIGAKTHYENPFMYVQDEKMLGMVGMFLSGYIKKVEKFVLREKALLA